MYTGIYIQDWNFENELAGHAELLVVPCNVSVSPYKCSNVGSQVVTLGKVI